MHIVSQLLGAKRRWSGGEKGVETILGDRSVLDAARKMNEARIGSLVVTDRRDRVAGIITERDMLTRVIAAGRDPSATPVEAVMTREVYVCGPGETLDGLRREMRSRRIRHVPVLEGDRLAGLVSIGDLNAAEHEDLEITIRVMEEYITHG